jgi:toxin secretion/phage lysis holin
MREELFDYKLLISALTSFLSFFFGGFDTGLIVLISFMAMDQMTGLMKGYVNKALSSKTGYRGIMKKAGILLVLIVSVLLDRLINNGTMAFRTLVVYFYVANEALSILENIAKCGVPLPKKLIEVLEQLKNKGGN